MTLAPHQRFLQRCYLSVSRLRRGMTLGVRAMLLKDRHVLLVRHSYVPGWYFPGGGVEIGESVTEALQREIREEAGAALTAPPQIFGVYRSAHADRRDHVVLFVCREWTHTPPALPNGEIVAAELFPVDAVPEDAGKGTKARLREVFGGGSPAADW